MSPTRTTENHFGNCFFLVFKLRIVASRINLPVSINSAYLTAKGQQARRKQPTLQVNGVAAGAPEVENTVAA